MHVISLLLGNLDACESYVEEKNTPVPIRVKPTFYQIKRNTNKPAVSIENMIKLCISYLAVLYMV